MGERRKFEKSKELLQRGREEHHEGREAAESLFRHPKSLEERNLTKGNIGEEPP